MKLKPLPVLLTAAALVAVVCCVIYVQSKSPSGGNAAAPAPATATVDGKAMYKKAFETIKAKTFLMSAERLENWVKDWETKYDGQDLTTLGAADSAIESMAKSAGAQYIQPSSEPAKVDSRAGIGVTVELGDAKELLKQLPADATQGDAEKALKISKEHPFRITGVVSGSPASQALLVAAIKSGDNVKIAMSMEDLQKRGIRAGQTLVLAGTHNAADQKLVDGLTLREAIDLIKGEAGTIATIRVNDVDSDGEPVQLQFICRRAAVRVKGVEAKALSGGAWLLSVENLMSSTSRADFIAAASLAKDAKALIIDLRRLAGLTPENVGTIVESLVDQPGITYQLMDRNGDGLASFILGDNSYTVKIFKTKKPLDLDLSGHRYDRAPLAIPETVPVVFLTSDASVSARSAIEVVKKARGNVKVIGSSLLEPTRFSATVQLDYGRMLQIVEFETLPGGVRTKELKLDVELSAADINDNAKAIAAALTAAGIRPEEKPAR